MFACLCVCVWGGGTCIPRGHSTRIRRHSNEQRVPDPASGSGDNVAEEEDLFGAVGGEGVKEESGYVGSADVAKAKALAQAERQAAGAAGGSGDNVAEEEDLFGAVGGEGVKEESGYVGSADVAKAMALVQAERQAAAAAVDGDIFEVTFGHGQKEKKGGCTIL